jgi:hypothetical protein
MSRSSRALSLLCAIAVPLSFYLFAASPAAAKHRSHIASKHKAAKHGSGRHKSARHRSEKDDLAEDENSSITLQTPADKDDCINISQAFYRRAASAAARTKHGIPPEFEKVASNLDVLCGEEEFEKARVSMDWMNTCLQNFTQDSKLGYCSRNKSYFCAIDPASESCRTSDADKALSEFPE